jgi:hypothetical protein
MSNDDQLGLIYTIFAQLVMCVIGLLPGIGIGYWIWG